MVYGAKVIRETWPWGFGVPARTHAPVRGVSTAVTVRVFRYSVPIDGRWHPLKLSGAVVAVGRPPLPGLDRDEHEVELWALHDDEGAEVTRHFAAFGTGDAIDAPCDYVGTAFGVGGRAVWHLMEHWPTPNGSTNVPG